MNREQSDGSTVGWFSFLLSIQCVHKFHNSYTLPYTILVPGLHPQLVLPAVQKHGETLISYCKQQNLVV